MAENVEEGVAKEGGVEEAMAEEGETESGRGSAPMLQLLPPLPEPPSPFTRAGEVVTTPMTSLSPYSIYRISWAVYIHNSQAHSHTRRWLCHVNTLVRTATNSLENHNTYCTHPLIMSEVFPDQFSIT